ncbi:MAG: PASTA domain-containing protein [Myxococcales bacterium]|nr:MAG: PASTA domain-containing protein [Myxococcales bacterium]
MQTRNSFSRRLAIVGAFAAAAALVIVARMYWLKVVKGPELAGQAHRISCGDAVRLAYRGPIVDRHGATLATTVAAARVGMRRNEYVYEEQAAELLAPLLGYERDEMTSLLRDDPRRFVWLSKSVGVDETNTVRRLGIPGVDVHDDQRRTYPQGSMAAQLIGFVGTDTQGLEGIERLFDEGLRGVPQSVRVCRDVRGRVFHSTRDVSGMNHGATVQLTIDAMLQGIAESELQKQVEEYDAQGGSVVVLDPATGEVLAMASAPSFDPNFYHRSEVGHRRNRVITDMFEPGSTTKPLLVAAALDAGAIQPDDVYFCENGAMQVGGWTIHDHHPYGDLSVPDILRVSSNICSAKIGAKLGAESFHRYLRGYGFGARPGTGLQGEITGILPPVSNWRPIHVANIAFGQGVSVSALQLASAFSTLANEGTRMRPYVVRRVIDAEGKVVSDGEPLVAARVLSAESARLVSKMLEAVVEPGGTAPRAGIEGIRVAGKTGTAQKVKDGRYSHKDFVASFVGYLPADDPRLVIAVSIDEPRRSHYGGVVAAPVFRRVAEAALDYLHIYRAPHLIEGSLPIEASASQPEPPAVGEFDGTMPDLRGLSLRSAIRAIDGCACRLRIDGDGYVIEQEPEPGVELASMSRVSLVLAGRQD